jgi:hypothetical protein
MVLDGFRYSLASVVEPHDNVYPWKKHSMVDLEAVLEPVYGVGDCDRCGHCQNVASNFILNSDLSDELFDDFLFSCQEAQEKIGMFLSHDDLVRLNSVLLIMVKNNKGTNVALSRKLDELEAKYPDLPGVSKDEGDRKLVNKGFNADDLCVSGYEDLLVNFNLLIDKVLLNSLEERADFLGCTVNTLICNQFYDINIFRDFINSSDTLLDDFIRFCDENDHSLYA